MSKLFVKTLSLIIATLFALSMLSGCGGSTAGGTKEAADAAAAGNTSTDSKQSGDKVSRDFVTLRVLYPGDESKRMTEFLANEFKEKIKDELNLGMEVSYSPWDQYWNKKDMMIAAREQIDWYWDGSPNFTVVLAKKQCVELDELLDKYGADLKRVIPAENFDAFRSQGKCMAIPSSYCPTSETFKSVLVRQDLLEEVGMTEIKSIADLEMFAEKAKVKNPGINVFAQPTVHALGRELSEFPFVYAGVTDIIGVNENTKKAYSYFESEAFKKHCELARKWYLKGYIPDDVTIKFNEDVNRMKTGNYLVNLGAISRPMEDINDLRMNVPGARLKEYLIAPEVPKYKFVASSEVICIGSTAKYPERAMEFLNWIYKSQENYLFCLYGVEGKDYTIENGRIIQINTDSLFYEWMFRNLNYMLFPDSVDDDFIQTFKAWDNGAKLSCTFGFLFDSTPVKAEESKINTVFDEKIVPLAAGFVDYEEKFPEMVEALKTAGIDEYIAEYQRQLDAYLAGK